MKNNMIYKALTIAFALGFISLLGITLDETKKLKTEIDSLKKEVILLNDQIDVRDDEIDILKELVDSDFDRINDIERLDLLRTNP